MFDYGGVPNNEENFDFKKDIIRFKKYQTKGAGAAVVIQFRGMDFHSVKANILHKDSVLCYIQIWF